VARTAFDLAPRDYGAATAGPELRGSPELNSAGATAAAAPCCKRGSCFDGAAAFRARSGIKAASYQIEVVLRLRQLL
jgi:hypothetical protein